MMTTNRQSLACPYCGQPLRIVPQRWFNRSCYQCDRCGDFPDLGASEPAREPQDGQRAHRLHIPPGTGRPRVLLVDDAKEQRDLYALMLEETAMVLTASRGEDALAIARETPLDAIIVDVLMPGMSGWELCARLKEEPRTREVPVIILTSLDGAEAAGPAHRAGAEAVLMKPCPVERLASTIEAVVAVQAVAIADVPTRALVVARQSAVARRHVGSAVRLHAATRRWPRKMVEIPLAAHIGSLPVRLVNISYTGLCLAIEAPPIPLPPSVDLTCSTVDATIRASVVWRSQRDARTWLWGAEIAFVPDEWCALVDAH
jgi:CheY-like chemotaxis protein